MKMKPTFPTLAAITLLAACTSMNTPVQTQAQQKWREQQTENPFEANGRIGIKMQQTGHNASFDWTRQNQVETLDINTPLGNTVGQLCRDKTGVIATDYKGRQYTADTPEALSRQLLGYPLPLQHLSVWANGEWVKGIPHRFGTEGQLQQLGWQIRREANEDGSARVLQLENGQLTLRMVFTQYQTLADDSGRPSQCAARAQAAAQ